MVIENVTNLNVALLPNQLNTTNLEPEDEFSLPSGPDEPETGEFPDANATIHVVGASHSHDPLAEESETMQASITAVAVPFQNAPIPRDVAGDALKKLEFILDPSKAASANYKPPKLNSMFSIRRLGAMAACLRYYCSTKLNWSLTYSSEIAALGAGYGTRFGKNLRRFIRAFVNTDHLPENQYGTWNSSILEDEDLATELKDYLVECKGRYMRAQDIVEYLDQPDVKQRFKLDEPPSLRTAQRWLKEFGFRWGLDPKGQYVDGHEREDVVKYRNESYIPLWTELETQMCWYDSVTMEKHMPNLRPGERMVMIWFHDESIFCANDRRLTRWVHSTESAVPYAKGEGATIMVADFVGLDGWLCGSDLLSCLVIIDQLGALTPAKIQKR
ncbi:hypothetical protein BN14_10111 [Rhizoctonia solani AG-1 IB]|nr:hypothetical protein BN14_10111 [Rhizoctonia solani AG-1 IB]